MEKKSAKKKEKKTKGKKETKEEICEIFDIEKDGKEKTVKVCGTEEQKEDSGQVKKENKLMKKAFIIMMIILGSFLITYFIIQSFNHFEYEGVKFDIIKQGSLTLYRTSLPVTYQGEVVPYYFYFRKDPRTLKNINFDGKIRLKEDMVINMTQDFNCNGDGIIAIANLLNLYEVLEIKAIKDENATCDDIYGRYNFLRIKEGNETMINEFGFEGGCYNLYIKDCEILEGTEKLMLETLAEVNKRLKELKTIKD